MKLSSGFGKSGDFNKKESEGLVFTGLEIILEERRTTYEQKNVCRCK